MTTGPRVLVLAALPAAGIELLGRRFVVETGGRPDGAVAVVTDPSIRVDADFLDAGGGMLRVVANFGVGYDNIDLDAARERGVTVTNTPGVLTGATAELAVALMLAAARRIAEADAMVRRGEWARSGADELLGRDLGAPPLASSASVASHAASRSCFAASTFGCSSHHARTVRGRPDLSASSCPTSWPRRTS